MDDLSLLSARCHSQDYSQDYIQNQRKQVNIQMTNLIWEQQDYYILTELGKNKQTQEAYSV